MITAAECKELVESSTKNVDRILKVIEPKIRETAEKGERSLFLYEEGLWGAYEFRPKATPLQLRVMATLAACPLSFGVQFTTDGNPYVPRGLQDEHDGSGPEYVNWGIKVHW